MVPSGAMGYPFFSGHRDSDTAGQAVAKRLSKSRCNVD